MIPDRSLEVLRAIVQDYIASKEPVGSKSLVERHQFGVSSATIRNEMAMLEEEELIHAPHTSAGRVPTEAGLRLFVDGLLEVGDEDDHVVQRQGHGWLRSVRRHTCRGSSASRSASQRTVTPSVARISGMPAMMTMPGDWRSET